MDTKQDMRMELRESRIRLQQEIRRALSCIRKTQKIKLAAEWKAKYSPAYYAELIRCAKNKEVARSILDWKLDEL